MLVEELLRTELIPDILLFTLPDRLTRVASPTLPNFVGAPEDGRLGWADGSKDTLAVMSLLGESSDPELIGADSGDSFGVVGIGGTMAVADAECTESGRDVERSRAFGGLMTSWIWRLRAFLDVVGGGLTMM